MTQPVPTTTLLDPETGAAIDGVPLAEVGDYVRQGAVVPDGQTVPVNTGSEIVNLTGQEANQFFTSLDSIGASVSTPQAYAQQEERKSFDTPLNTLGAAGLGAARGLTFGLSDMAADSLGGGDYVRKAQQYNPGASIAGEVAGMALPLLLTEGAAGGAYAARGGLGAAQVAGRAAEGASLAGRALEGAALAGRAAEGAGMAAEASRGAGLLTRGLEIAAAPTRAVTAFGEGAGALASRGLGALGMVEEGLAARSLSTAARMGVEGGFYGMGQAVSESVLKDDPLTVEKLVAGFGQGAALGGVLGGGGTLLAAGARAGAGKLAGAGESLFSKLAGGESKLAAKEASAAEKLAEGVVPKTETGAKALLSKLEEEMTLKATGAQVPDTRAFNKLSAGAQKRAVTMFADEVLSQGSTLSREAKAAAVEAMVKREGAAIGDAIRAFDDAGVRPEIGNIFAPARASQDGLAALISGKGSGASAAKKLGQTLDELETKIGNDGSFASLQDAKRQIGDMVRWDKVKTGTATPLDKAYADLYKAIDNEIGRAGDLASKQVGTEAAAGWAKAKEGYQAALWLRQATERGLDHEMGRRAFGLSENIGSMAGMVGGAVLGGGFGAAAGGALLGAAQGFVRRHGADVAANMARSVTRGEMLSQVARTVDETVGKRIGDIARAVPKLPGGQATIAATYEAQRAAVRANTKPPTRKERDQEYDRQRERVAETLTAPDKVRERFSDVAQVNPRLADAMTSKATQGAAFLQSKMPPGVATVGLQPKYDKVEPSPAEKDKFMRYARAVENPLSVLEDAAKGQVTREGVEALRAVYPALYGELQRQVSEHVTSLKRPLTYAEKAQIGALVGVPADRTFAPENMRDFQSAMANVIPQGGPQGGPSGGGPAPNLAKGMQSKTSELEGFRLWHFRTRQRARRLLRTRTFCTPTARPETRSTMRRTLLSRTSCCSTRRAR